MVQIGSSPLVALPFLPSISTPSLLSILSSSYVALDVRATSDSSSGKIPSPSLLSLVLSRYTSRFLDLPFDPIFRQRLFRPSKCCFEPNLHTDGNIKNYRILTTRMTSTSQAPAMKLRHQYAHSDGVLPVPLRQRHASSLLAQSCPYYCLKHRMSRSNHHVACSRHNVRRDT